MPQEKEVTHLGIYNALSEKKQNYKALVTTTKLWKYDFYPSGATLPKSSKKQKVVINWFPEHTGVTQSTPPGKIAFHLSFFSFF